tara:strand:- start:2547 stop:3062 length:516 start_codon:yes stop_codon:yes gene_type:complete
MEKQLSQSNKAIIEAYNRGYRCDDSGKIFKPDGSLQKLSYRSKYAVFGIRYKNKIPVISGHRFIMFCRVGEKLFTKGLMVLHRNDEPSDNSPKNLYLGTNKDNARDCIRNDKYVKRGTYKHLYDEIYNHYLVFGQKKTYRRYKISQGNLMYIIKKYKNAKHTASSQISIPF